MCINIYIILLRTLTRHRRTSMFFEIWVLWGDAGFFAALCVRVAQLVGLRLLLGRTFVPGHRFADDFRRAWVSERVGALFRTFPLQRDLANSHF